MNDLINSLLIICPLIFLSGFVDSIAGGGGLISLPAYFLAGLPAHLAMGTNKTVASTGALLATIKYFRHGKLLIKVALFSAIGAIIGAFFGSNLALFIPENILGIIILIILPIVAVFLATQKNLGDDNATPRNYSFAKHTIYALLIGISIGFYDGLVGPGTGTFMIIAFSKVFNLDLVTSSGCAKMSNLASNLASAVVFTLAGQVMWQIIIPAALSCMLGAHFGARYAIKGGSKSVRKVIYIVIALLFIKFIIELI